MSSLTMMGPISRRLKNLRTKVKAIQMMMMIKIVIRRRKR